MDVRTRPGLPRLLVFVFPATTGMYAVYQSVQSILLPAQVERLDPDGKVGTLALLTTLAAVAAMLALPAGGAISDRTRSRFGRRTPWIVLTAIVSAALLVGMGLTSALVVLGVLYVLLWFASNFYQGAISAILPDQVPVHRRGLAAAVIGLGTPVGVLIGVNIVSRVSQFWGYTIIAAIFVAVSLAFVGAREPSSLDIVPVRPPRGAAVRTFLRAFRSHDFRYAFASRFGLFLAYFTVGGYIFYAVQDYIGAANVPDGDVPVAVSTLATVSLVAWIVVATFCGWLADRVDRRKLFGGVSAAGLAAAQLIPVLSPTWTGMLVYAALSGAAIGTYSAVDLAVMSLVLPNEGAEGRDLAILAAATGLPQIVSAALASALITWFGGYVTLFAFSAVCAVVAGLLIMRIRAIS